MNQGSAQPQPAPDASDPYERLGVAPDASFDTVQEAKLARLREAGDDPMVRSRIEAAYDAVLMDRLKERQQGRVSSAARSASQREQASPPPSRPALSALPSLPQLPPSRLPRPSFSLPRLQLASGRELWFPLAADGVLLVLLVLMPGAAPELLTALATGVTLLNLQRRNGRFLASVGWSFALLCLGLVLGGLLAGGLGASLSQTLPVTTLQLQSLPAILLLLLGALLIA
ncbi:CPP1-like family protein [Synechococcus sp. BA-124 BA4]|uniref:CPP1-like family protein n=1 Tax=Synechococcus sp. BA-124 BA4 TaxID=3110251 RepID=UPI002B201357|nr:CPP1-like family protein [Synechococcus sp. BA-124 BA4]MEA5399410.1 CPP1-like family protein [Synechococcus sp. BA-124 BA4]MEA5410904.1 CPP1-like family protein [Synechococcus sp. BA-120 BA3]